MIALHIRTFAQFFICILIGAVFSSIVAFAWTGPTQSAPNGNVAAPINVGTTDQTKNGGLGVNSLAVFGNAILSGTSRYLNFNVIPVFGDPSSGYGIRDNAGTVEFKNTGDTSWSSIATIVTNTVTTAIQTFFASGSTNTVGQIKFADGTTQTTAAGVGGLTSVTTATCSGGSNCAVSCPETYFRTGCSIRATSGAQNSLPSAEPSGTNACLCSGVTFGSLVCYAYCAK